MTVPTRSLTLLVALAGIVTPALAQPAFQASEDPNTIVIRVTEHFGLEGDDTPLLRIYGDGRVLVHFREDMTRAGDYSLQLSPTDLNELLQTAVNGGLMEFKEITVKNHVSAARSNQRQATLARGEPITLTWQSETVLCVIGMELAGYTATNGARTSNLHAHRLTRGTERSTRTPLRRCVTETGRIRAKPDRLDDPCRPCANHPLIGAGPVLTL